MRSEVFSVYVLRILQAIGRRFEGPSSTVNMPPVLVPFLKASFLSYNETLNNKLILRTLILGVLRAARKLRQQPLKRRQSAADDVRHVSPIQRHDEITGLSVPRTEAHVAVFSGEELAALCHG